MDFLKENNLLSLIFEEEWDADKKEWKGQTPSNLAAYDTFIKDFLFVRENKTNGLITISVITQDPDKSSFLANKIILCLLLLSVLSFSFIFSAIVNLSPNTS